MNTWWLHKYKRDVSPVTYEVGVLIGNGIFRYTCVVETPTGDVMSNAMKLTVILKEIINNKLFFKYKLFF